MRKRSAICILSLMLAFSTVLFAACGNGDDNVSEEPLPNQLEFTFEDYTFGETASTPVVTKTPFDNAAITYTYEGRNETEYAESNTAPVNAGEYTITGTAAATDAYKSAEYSVNFTVEKAENQLQFTFADYNYGAAASLPAITKAPNEDAAVSYVYKGRNDTVYAESATAPTDIGEYTVTGTAAATANYNAAEYSVDFSVVKAKNRLVFTFADYTYGETASAPVVTEEPFGDVAVTYTYEGRNDTEYAKSETAPSNAGEYTVTGSVAATDGYESVSYAVDFTVEKADNQLEFTFGGYTYGSAASTPNVTKEPFENAQISYTYIGRNDTDYEENTAAPSYLGDYTIKGVAAATANYNAATYSVDFSVTRAEAAANEIEFFDANGTDSQIKATNANCKWLEEYEGEEGVIELSFSQAKIMAINVIQSRRSLDEYKALGLARVYLKVYMPEETTGVKSIQIINDGKNTKTFSKGEWHLLTFMASCFENNYDVFEGKESSNAFMINCETSTATGNIYISEFGYLPSETNEIEFFTESGTEKDVAVGGGPSVAWVEEYEGENGVLELSFSNAGALALMTIIPRQTLAKYEDLNITQVYLKIYIPEETTGVKSINILKDGEGTGNDQKALEKGKWQTIIFNASCFEDNYNVFAGIEVNNAFFITCDSATKATGKIYVSEFGYISQA